MKTPQFDATSDPEFSPDRGQQATPPPFLGIQFRCCHAYGRVYRNAAQTRYEGRCPGCGRLLTVPIGQGGSSRRFFRAE